MTDGISDNLSPAQILGLFRETPAVRTVRERMEKILRWAQEQDTSHRYPGFKDDDRTAVIIQI